MIAYINKAKKENASIVLSDKVALTDSRICFKDLSGFLKSAIKTFRGRRQAGGGGVQDISDMDDGSIDRCSDGYTPLSSTGLKNGNEVLDEMVCSGADNG